MHVLLNHINLSKQACITFIIKKKNRSWVFFFFKSSILQVESWLFSRCAKLHGSSQWEVIPACSSGKHGKTHISSSGEHQYHIIPGTRVLPLKWGSTPGIFLCVFSLYATTCKCLSAPQMVLLWKAVCCVLCKSACSRPQLSQSTSMIPCFQDTQNPAEQTGLNPWALFQGDTAKGFMRSHVWRQEENIG